VKIPGSELSIWCDVTTGNSRPFLTRPFRRVAFEITQSGTSRDQNHYKTHSTWG